MPIVSTPRTKGKEFRDGLALGKVREANLQELHLLTGGGDCLFAFVQMDRCVLPKSLSSDGTGACSYKVNRMAGQT